MPTTPAKAVARAIHHVVYNRTKEHRELRKWFEGVLTWYCAPKVTGAVVDDLRQTTFYKNKVAKHICPYCHEFHRNLKCTLNNKKLQRLAKTGFGIVESSDSFTPSLPIPEKHKITATKPPTELASTADIQKALKALGNLGKLPPTNQ